MLLDGKIALWEASAFISLYALYAAAVWASELALSRSRARLAAPDPSLADPLLLKVALENSLPQWSSAHQHQELQKEGEPAVKSKQYFVLLYRYGIEWPLALPRRLTIPVIEEGRWSRPLAVASATLGPVFVGGVWMLQSSASTNACWIALGTSGGLGIIFGLLAFFNTENSRPPRRFLWVWLAGGFLMSIVWFYIVADELVASLEALGEVFSIDPAILGLTVLAWGNSIGDLVADLALACSGKDGVQIAISGCYAGPLFNTIVGLGLSLVIACWRSSPEPLLIVHDNTLFYMIGFLAAGLAWALVIMPLKGMRLSRTLGAGLVLVYCSFLATGMCYAMGWISQ